MKTGSGTRSAENRQQPRLRRALIAELRQRACRDGSVSNSAMLEVLAACTGRFVSRFRPRSREEVLVRFLARVRFHADAFAGGGNRSGSGTKAPDARWRR